ncbi:LOW QUALITY PROTEIN: armadillo repeat-containing protein 7 [Onthophagus taurus]|uniref:LOW QUALITY PROTEIN: armadillo repeat-containing protein 7 n=1 Tax=Onthophagus taurus TaxID=166361 RepID=UPI0039BE5CAE
MLGYVDMFIMFSRKEQLNTKTGPDGVGRREYLQQLVDEFNKTQSYDAKQQILANLANFAYDPINYDFIKELHITQLFLSQLTDSNEELLEFSLAGLCNLSSDPTIKDIIIKSNGVFLISQQLLHRNEEIALNALTTLIFLITPESQASITTPDIINKVLHYKTHSNARFKNLSTIFLDDFCSQEQIDCAKKLQLNTVDIPLPQHYPFFFHFNMFRRAQFNKKSLLNFYRHSSFKVGDKVTVERKITKSDVKSFGEITGDINPVHFPENSSSVGVVHGAFLNGIVSGIIGTRLPGPGTLVVSQSLNFPNKCFVGEKISVEVELMEMRKIIKVKFVCEVKDKAKIVMYGDAKLIKK